MSSSQSRRVFDAVPGYWFEPVVALWVVVLAGVGIQVTLGLGQQLLGPLGAAPWAAVPIVVLVAAVAYVVFGFGLTLQYRSYRGFEPHVGGEPFDAVAWRWLAGLGVLAPALMVLGGLASGPGYVATQVLGFDLPAAPEGMTGLTLGLTGVNEMLNQAPVVLVVAVLAGVLVGPAVGAVFHGVLQDAIASVAPPVVAVAATAILTTAVLASGTVTSATTLVVFGFVLAVASAYRATENLAVPMAAYGVFNALALVLAWLDVLVSLYTAGHLFG